MCNTDKFYENFVKTLFSRYGFITFKTGRMDEGKATIADCLDVLKANSPVFLLDCFDRPAATDWKEAKSNHEKNPRVMWLSEDRCAHPFSQAQTMYTIAFL